MPGKASKDGAVVSSSNQKIWKTSTLNTSLSPSTSPPDASHHHFITLTSHTLGHIPWPCHGSSSHHTLGIWTPNAVNFPPQNMLLHSERVDVLKCRFIPLRLKMHEKINENEARNRMVMCVESAGAWLGVAENVRTNLKSLTRLALAPSEPVFPSVCHRV